MSVCCICLLLVLAQVYVQAHRFDTLDGNGFRSDYKFSHEAAGWLKLHRVPLDWHTARVQCYYEGAVLASPLNAHMWSALSNLLVKANLDYTLVYSGVSATFNDGVYASVEGIPLEQLHIHWDKGQPDNFGGQEQCVAYYKHQDVLTVHDESCTRLLPYVCYRPASASDNVTKCGTVDQEYKLQPRTEHCYKLHAHGLPWSLAARVCRAEGGYLLDINSEEEANLLADMFSDVTSVGFRLWGDKTWWTVHGKRLEDSGYSRWHSGEPNNSGGKEACGSVMRDKTFNDVACDQPYVFICEKHPDSLLNLDGDVI